LESEFIAENLKVRGEYWEEKKERRERGIKSIDLK